VDKQQQQKGNKFLRPAENNNDLEAQGASLRGTTCLGQLHVEGPQSQRGAPGLLWEEEGGHVAVIVSGPVEEEEEEEEEMLLMSFFIFK